jgi:hypothetical protein
MRNVFVEGDLVSAEVQALQHDGTVALHTRSRKYGKVCGESLLVLCRWRRAFSESAWAGDRMLGRRPRHNLLPPAPEWNSIYC